jgi:hypothetical protein
VHSTGPAAIDLAALAGLYLDDWEQLVVTEMLAERDIWYFNEVLERDMRTYAAFELGLVVSRQNGKGSCLEARELAGLFLLGERLIIHSAHEFPTSAEAFERVATLIENTPTLSKELKRGGIKQAHGSEGIYLKSGQRLIFKTRTKGGVRGFTSDCLILDEAMMGLQAQAVGALIPTLSARPNPQIIYAGSAGGKEAEQLGRVRGRAVRAVKELVANGLISEERLAFLEWSIDAHNDFCKPDCTEHDRQYIDESRHWTDLELDIAAAQLVESYRKANPGLGIRITVEHIEAERRTMGKEEFARERLGVGDWPVEAEAWRVIDEDSWMSRLDLASQAKSPLVFAADTTPDCSYSCIAVGGFNGELIPSTVDEVADAKGLHVEITQDGQRYDHRPGRGWVVGRMKQLIDSHNPAAIILDKGGQAGVFADELESWLEREENRGKYQTKLIYPTMREYAQACGMFHGAVVARRDNVPYLVHMNQPMLTSAVAGADKRDLAALWAWDKRNATVDISPLVACTLALWGVHRVGHEVPAATPWVLR